MSHSMATLMSESDRQKLAAYFAERLERDVRVHFYTRRTAEESVGDSCVEAGKLVAEVASLSERLELSVSDIDEQPSIASDAGVHLVPTIVIEADGSATGGASGQQRFIGLPAGNEFPNLIDALVDASTGDSKLSPEIREGLAAVRERVHIQVFATPT